MRYGRAMLLGGVGVGLLLTLLIGLLLAPPAVPAAASGAGAGPEPPRCQPASACPDLVVRSARPLVPPANIRHRPRTTFLVELANEGAVRAKASNTALRVFVGDQQISFADVWTRALEPGERRTISLTVPGRFDAAVQCAFLVADSRVWVDESDENNLLTVGACGG